MSGGEFSSGNPIVFGPKEEWIGLYSLRQECASTLNEARDASQDVQEMLREDRRDLLKSAQEMTDTKPPEITVGEDFIAGTGAFIAHLDNKLHQNRNIQEDAAILGAKAQTTGQDARKALETASNTYDTSVDLVRAKAIGIADQYTTLDIPFPPYITRTIGSIGVKGIEDDTWKMVAGAIEAFRFVHDVRREDIVLGKANDQPWSQDALSELVNDIQHLQLLQILRSPNPKLTTIQLGRKGLLAQVGRPPVRPTSEDIQWHGDTWLGRALTHLGSMEPTNQGLLADRDK